jgi:uncharacterized membrane protein AbrB (regulator of aidB expression)
VKEIDFKTVGLILTLAIISCWLIRFVAVPQGYLTIPVIPSPIAFPQLPPTQIEFQRIWSDIASLILGFTAITIMPRIHAKRIEELRILDWMGIICAATSITLSIWGASLIGH